MAVLFNKLPPLAHLLIRAALAGLTFLVFSKSTSPLLGLVWKNCWLDYSSLRSNSTSSSILFDTGGLGPVSFEIFLLTCSAVPIS